VTIVDRKKEAENYIYAEIVDAATKLCMFETWEHWTGWAMGPEPAWQREWTDNIDEFRRRVIRTLWPGTIPELECALKTLSLNLAMARKLFWKHSETEDGNWIRGKCFYRSARGESTYDELLALYNEWIDEQEDFLFEATKSANWVAEIVRHELNPLFFAVPGKFVVTVGPGMNAAFATRVVEYNEEEKRHEPEAVIAKIKAIEEKEQGKLELK
jgi:hypothetical protein